MAVSVDTVYQRVLAILNKEQRGYLTPQEFNLFANQAQLDIFEQYFYDISQYQRNNLVANDTEYADALDILNDKINGFEANGVMTYSNSYWSAPADVYRIGTIIYNNIEAERIKANEFLYINQSPLTKPRDSRPIFVASDNGYKVYGDTELTTGVTCNYIKKPASVAWGYNTIAGQALYNASTSTDFELHPSEEPTLVNKILALAGLSTKQVDAYQAGMQADAIKDQKERT